MTDVAAAAATRMARGPEGGSYGWRSGVTPYTALTKQPYMPGNVTLMQWGPLQFQVWPLNVHEFDIETGTAWAQKEIAGAAIYREWVGENDELLHFRGKLFPYRIGGMANLEAFDALRRAGVASIMVRGDGAILGWFVCEKLIRQHRHLSGEGVGQDIDFEAAFARVPVPNNQKFLSNLWTTMIGS